MALVPVLVGAKDALTELGQAERTESGGLKLLPPSVDSSQGIWVEVASDGRLTEVTDLAALAQEVLGEGRRVKRLRTARTLIVAAKTALYCYDLVVSLTALAVVLMAVSFSVQVFLLFQLWGLSRDLEKQQSP